MVFYTPLLYAALASCRHWLFVEYSAENEIKRACSAVAALQILSTARVEVLASSTVCQLPGVQLTDGTALVVKNYMDVLSDMNNEAVG